ncbi:MAG: hypothetical protein F4Y35_02510 [Chloroflexi bacterium]|nr:hypothetical protein [Chloroflexota bacterium]
MAATTTMTAPRPTLEELVDRIIDAAFDLEPPAHPSTSPARAIHEARRLRQVGELDAALEVFAELDLTESTDGERRWIYVEFLELARRRFRAEPAELYCSGVGRAAVLTPYREGDDETLQARAVLGMRWQPGKLLSRRSLRGLRPLANGGAL